MKDGKLFSLTAGVILAITQSSFPDDNKVVALTLYHEARGEGIIGMRAVGKVIQNRARECRTTPARICLQPRQFSYWNDNRRIKLKLYPPKDDPSWKASQRLALDISTGKLHVPSLDKFSHYNHVSIKRPEWKIYQSKQVGKHMFYKLPPQQWSKHAQDKHKGKARR